MLFRKKDIAILGTGRFSLAIIHIISRNVGHVTVYGRDEKQLKELYKHRTNSKYSPKKLNIKITARNLKNYDSRNHDITFYCLPVKCLESRYLKNNMILTYMN